MSIMPHTILPDRLVNRLRTSPMMYRLGLRKSRHMSVGVGSGLRFEPGSSNRHYASGNNELPVQQALASCLGRGAVFYDIGANVGFFTVIAARLVGPHGSVYAFEPVPENAACIQLNVDLNRFRNVTVVSKAVSSSPGQGQFWLTEYAGGGALTTAVVPPDATQLIDVDLVSIDDLVFQQKWRPPAVVKIDVEGAEIDVLQGMLCTLREIRPVVIYEIDDERLAGFQKKYHACESVLTELGYRVTRLVDSYPELRWIVGHAIAMPC
jgi:FkbM family methyltransferase